MSKKIVVDHLGRTVSYTYPPKRIISLVPGITDTLYALHLENEIVGRTRYCIYPKDAVHQATTIGGTKRVMLDKIIELQPDLIIAEKEENTKEIVETLEKQFPVYVAEVQNVPDVYRLITDLGKVTNRIPEANRLQSTIQNGFESLPSSHGMKVAYVIWKNPYMVVGNDTYIHSLLDKMGFTNAFSDYEGRYPVVEEEDFQKAKLDYLFLASEPFPFKEEHKGEFSKFIPNVDKVIIDGEMFWYGPRMIDAVEYFRTFFQSLKD